MCGIAGLIDPQQSRESLSEAVLRMTDAVTHRGPDDAGHLVGDGAAIGMRRLSIIDVASGQQPIRNEAGDIAVVCNGEIYNHRRLRADLECRGHRFQTNSDAECIVHLYEEYGERCWEHLHGMFGVLLWDQSRGRFLIARDRLGKKPLFYAHRGERLWVGSEMKSLLAAAPELRQANHQTLGQFLQYGYIHQPETVYREIFRLPAGHFGVFERGRLRTSAYWTLEFAETPDVTPKEWAEQLDAALADAVRARLESEVPLGIFLSGGLDSSAVVAHAAEAGLTPLQTFTIGFDREEWDESEDALRVARHFGADAKVLQLRESDLRASFLDTVRSIVRHCDEPFGDASALPTYHISRLAREHVTVILSGDGGDELFAGYSSYRGARFAEKYRRRVPNWIGRHLLPSLARAAAGVLPGRHRYRALRASKVLRDSALPFLEAYRDKVCIWRPRELRQLLTPDAFAAAELLGDQYLPDDLWEILGSERDLISRLTEIDIRSYMLDGILVKVDRMSMAHSLEVRSPLLDHRVVELAARMPSSVKLRGAVGKAVLRDAVHGRLPPANLKKPKQGFSVPLRDWFRGPLRRLVEDYLLSGDQLPSELFQIGEVERTLRDHRAGAADHSSKIWLLLTFAAWHEQQRSQAASGAAPSPSNCLTGESL